MTKINTMTEIGVAQGEILDALEQCDHIAPVEKLWRHSKLNPVLFFMAFGACVREGLIKIYDGKIASSKHRLNVSIDAEPMPLAEI